jgi:hypothetical protein
VNYHEVARLTDDQVRAEIDRQGAISMTNAPSVNYWYAEMSRRQLARSARLNVVIALTVLLLSVVQVVLCVTNR